jgi:hypothetical protein
MEHYIHTALGAAIIVFGLFNVAIIQLRKGWPETRSRVMHCKISAFTPAALRSHTVNDVTGTTISNTLNSLGRTKTMKFHDNFQPSLLYKYVVDDEVYMSQNMYSGPCSRLDTGIMRFFSEGNYYPARYNPRNPQQAYLMFSSLWPYVFCVVIGCTMVFYQPLLEIGHQLYADH